MVTCNRASAKREDYSNFTFELGASAFGQKLAVVRTSRATSCTQRSSRHSGAGFDADASPGMTHVGKSRPIVRRDFHARLVTQMGMESPDNRPATIDRMG
jgi:hypothetical protein